MIKAIIFDWNGVIIEDLEVQARANCDIIEALGGKKITPEIWFKEITQDWKLFFIKYGVKEKNISEVLPLMSAYYPKYFNLAKIDKNTKQVLEKLKTEGILAGVLSGTNKKSILDNIKRFSLEGIFSFIISGEDVKNQKPNPEGLIKAIENCRAGFQEILYIDDMPTIFDETNKLGITSVGFKSKINSDFSKAKFIIKNLSEVDNIIKQFN